MDRRYLTVLAEHYGGGPVGVDTVAAALSEQRDTLEEVIEPYLIQQGFLMRTQRGRALTPASYKHLGLIAPQRLADQFDMLEESKDEGPAGD
jgi:Holliday junction DNA helicase RuvB